MGKEQTVPVVVLPGPKKDRSLHFGTGVSQQALWLRSAEACLYSPLSPFSVS